MSSFESLLFMSSSVSPLEIWENVGPFLNTIYSAIKIYLRVRGNLKCDTNYRYMKSHESKTTFEIIYFINNVKCNRVTYGAYYENNI